MAIQVIRRKVGIGKVWVRPLSHWAVFALLPNGDEEFLGYYPRRDLAEEAEAVAAAEGWQVAQERWQAQQVLQEDRIEYPHDARDGQIAVKRGQTYRCAAQGETHDTWVTHCALCGVRFEFLAPLLRDGRPEPAFRARMYCDTHQLGGYLLPPHPASISRWWTL